MGKTIPVSPIIPSDGHVVVTPYEHRAEITGGGFLKPDTEVNRLTQQLGEIVAFSDKPFMSIYGKIIEKPKNLKIGTVIIHKSYGSEKIFLDGKNYRIANYSEIVGILK